MADRERTTISARAKPRVHTATMTDLGRQRFIGRLACIPVYEAIAFALRARRYEIQNRAHTRREYRRIVTEARRDGVPLVVCANHLTFIDSCLMIWAFGSSFWYVRNYRFFTWNLPAGDFFKKKLIFRVIAYLAKCIFIHRDGDKDHKDAVLENCRQLILRGEVVTVFPEGRRGRSGRFDAERMTYGVGKIIAGAPGCRVLCVYLRGHRQESFSNYPARGSRFNVRLALMEPTSAQTGRRAYIDIVQQIGQTIARLEDEHFRCLTP